MHDSTVTAIGRIRTGIGLLSTVLFELGILFMLGIWTVIWFFLSRHTAAVEGPIEGVILGAYTLLPVGWILLWRLSVRTEFELPAMADFIDTPGDTSSGPEPATESEIAQRFETGSS